MWADRDAPPSARGSGGPPINRRAVLASGATLATGVIAGCLDGGLDGLVDGTFGGEADATVAIVSGPEGFGDDDVNAEALAGLEAAASTYDIDVDRIEETDPSRYERGQAALAEEGYDVIVCVGEPHLEGLETNVGAYPTQRWMLVGAHVDSAESVSGWIAKKNEVSFLAGVAAGTLTREEIEHAGKTTNPDERIVGFIGTALEHRLFPIERSYVEGVNWVDEGIEILTSFVSHIGFPESTRTAADDQYRSGADVVYYVSRGRQVTVLKAARAHDRFALGSSVDQSVLDESYADVVPGSAVTAHDVATYRVAEAVIEGEWHRVRGNRYLDVETGGVGFAVGQAFARTPESRGRSGLDGPAKLFGEDAPFDEAAAVTALPDSLYENVERASEGLAAGTIELTCGPRRC